MAGLFRLIFLTPEKNIENEEDILVRLFEEGLKSIHLRKPFFKRSELESYIKKIPAKHHRKIVLHSHYSLCSHFNLKGIHLTGKTRKTFRKHQLQTAVFHISASFHSPADILRAKRKYNYVFLSPTIATKSGKELGENFLSNRASELERIASKQNVIALGGIQQKNLKRIKETGFKGAAMISALWSGDPLKNFKSLKKSGWL